MHVLSVCACMRFYMHIVCTKRYIARSIDQYPYMQLCKDCINEIILLDYWTDDGLFYILKFDVFTNLYLQQ